jgi:hypothetical protein
MRYIILGVTMLGDIIIWTVIVSALHLMSYNIFAWLIAILIVIEWHRTGGFIAWTRDGRQKFLTNARRIGL